MDKDDSCDFDFSVQGNLSIRIAFYDFDRGVKDWMAASDMPLAITSRRDCDTRVEQCVRAGVSTPHRLLPGDVDRLFRRVRVHNPLSPSKTQTWGPSVVAAGPTP